MCVIVLFLWKNSISKFRNLETKNKNKYKISMILLSHSEKPIEIKQAL